MLFGPYFHEKTWSAASYCSLKVTKPPESFKIEAKYAKVCFLWQGLIPGLLRGSQVSQPLDHQSSDKDRARWKNDQFKFDILFEHFPYISQPLCQVICTLMLVYHCHKPVLTPKIAIFRRAGMRKGRVATPTSFLIFDSSDMKSM